MSLSALDSEVSLLVEAVQAAGSLSELSAVKVRALGKKGVLTGLLKLVSQAPVADRPALGQAINAAKKDLSELIASRQADLESAAVAERIAQETLDVTLPGRRRHRGALHPVTRVIHKVTSLFHSLGFSVVSGQEIETPYYNFEALNIPDHHPARGEIDTFYFGDGRLLRTHTSPAQIHALENQELPLRVITPGRVYRRDSDQTHTPMFHQLEGLAVDRDLHFSELKGLLHAFFDAFFEQSVPLRFRPSYFPFTEPSAEVDIMHLSCQGAGCRTCGQSGWLEVLGCGMVHPAVLEKAAIDTHLYQGFAFGLGLDRLAMLRYGMDDLRTLFDNDLRMLEQF